MEDSIITIIMDKPQSILHMWCQGAYLSIGGNWPSCVAQLGCWKSVSSHGDAIARDAQGKPGGCMEGWRMVEVYQAQNISSRFNPALLMEIVGSFFASTIQIWGWPNVQYPWWFHKRIRLVCGAVRCSLELPVSYLEVSYNAFIPQIIHFNRSSLHYKHL